MSTDDVAAEDRADWYHDVVSQTVAPHRLVIPDRTAFRARAGVLGIGRIELSRHAHTDHRAWRTERLIRQSDPEHYILALITQGTKGISQSRNDTRADPGDMVFFDTSHPYAAGNPGVDDPVMSLLHIPRDLIRLPADRLDAALGSRLSVRRGIGAVLRQFLMSLETLGAECTPQELQLLERPVLDLVSGVLAQQLDAWDSLPAGTRNQVLLRRIDAFIDHHLANPELTPRAIAAHHHISLRTLHSVFQSCGETVAASIRRRRLERAHADLADPGQACRPVHTIACRWGFTSPAAFSRAFREAYGLSPRELRGSRPG
ncbi:helix-turn-helix domain-containing protein [Streptomyces sp. NPDC020141]|uniref:AraC-like ligand-binding domain-containing protein n=1 Tax=Streptomyces sp. NPDC020141 TaxID=3365065 RepID=UPI0037BA9723